MQTKRIFRSGSFLVISVILVASVSVLFNSPAKSVKADPLSKDPELYQESYDAQDGSIIITRIKVTPEQLQGTTKKEGIAPVLLEPSNGAILSTLIPRYTWEQVSPEITMYNFQLSRALDFSTVDEATCYIVPSQPPGSPIYGHTFSNLLPDTDYFWRVASGCYGSEVYSPIFSYRTAPSGGIILPAPNLLAPEDGATMGSTQVTFSLEPVDGAVRYQYRFYSYPDDGWEDWYSARISLSPITQKTFNPSATLYWRGAAANGYAFGIPSVMKSFTTPAVSGSTEISPTTGGTLTPGPGNISIVFPPGAVAQTTTLSYTLQPVPDHDLANFRFGGRAFTLTASDSNGNVTTFNQPFTLTIIYDSWDLLAADISNPSRLNLVFWDGSMWQEILPCAGCSIDTGTHTVTVVINHLSEFALVAPNETLIFLPVILK